MPTVAKRRLMPFIEVGPNRYAANDKRYIASAKMATINTFGPSGSLKKKNIVLEQTMAVAANMINETFFDLKYGFAIGSSMSI